MLAFALSLGILAQAPAATLETCKPSTVEEAYTCLDTILSEEVKAEMFAGSLADMIRYHRGLGMGIRNVWVRHGTLAGDERVGDRPTIDGMSSALLNGYWRNHHGCEPRFAEEAVAERGWVAAYQSLPEGAPMPELEIIEETCPAGGSQR